MLPRNCEICCSQFEDPKVLPCFHIVCKECAGSLRIKGRDELKCPINRCSKLFKCENMDPEVLPDALTVYHFQDLVNFRQKLMKNEVSCDICSKNSKEKTAVASCNRCNFICEDCMESHDNETAGKFSFHNVLHFSELKKSENEIPLEMLRRSRSAAFLKRAHNRCRIHSGELCNSYCLYCKALVCSTCVSSSAHSGHRCTLFVAAAEECKNILREHMPSIKLARGRVLGAIEAIKCEKTRVEDQKKTISSSIDSTFNALMKILQRRREELQIQLTELTNRKAHKLATQQIEVENRASEIERMVTFTENSLDTSTDSELLDIYSFLYSSIKNGADALSEERLRPVETANTTLKSSARKEMTDLCRKSLVVYSKQASPSNCTVVGEGLKTAKTMQCSQFRVNVVDKNHKPCQSIQDVVIKIKSSENGYESKALVHDTSMSQYHVSFCPEFKGKHEINIAVNGEAIRGSPFLLTVSMPPSQLGKPLGSIIGLMQPRGIMVTPSDELLVCEWSGKRIVRMDKLGRPVSSLEIKNLQHPASVAVHSSNEIFIVDGSALNGGIIKCSEEGKILKTVQGEGTGYCQFNNPRGIKISPENEVFVCDRDNNRIQIYDTELSFLRIIEFGSLNSQLLNLPAQPNDVAFTRTGSFYVTDYSNHCIHHFNSKEEYEFSFCQTREGKLAGPECIIVDDLNFLYVTESHGHRVSVFQLSGDCVSSFGSKGRNEGDFNFPMGIAVDSSGNVYVCELLNNRIQVF